MSEITSDRDKEIRSKYQCGYYTLPQVQLAYSLSRGETIAILCREPSVMDHQRKKLEIQDFIREIESAEGQKDKGD